MAPQDSGAHCKLVKRMRAVYTTVISQTKLVTIMLPARVLGVWIGLDELPRVVTLESRLPARWASTELEYSSPGADLASNRGISEHKVRDRYLCDNSFHYGNK